MHNLLSLGGLFILIGGVLLASGIVTFFHQRAEIKRSVLTTGSVIEIVRSRKSGDYLRVKSPDGFKVEPKYLYRPVVRFKTTSGKTVKFVANVAARPLTYEVGDEIEVIYNPEKPHKAKIHRFLYLWFYVLLLLFFGVFTMAMGALAVWL